ncbi:MAG: hypothetical protein R3C14_50305 [Caldilineaceae bacterium]
MNRHGLTGERLLAIFLVGCLVLNYPVLALFSRQGLLFGIPILYVFIFVCWLLIIALMAFVIERQH